MQFLHLVQHFFLLSLAPEVLLLCLVWLVVQLWWRQEGNNLPRGLRRLRQSIRREQSWWRPNRSLRTKLFHKGSLCQKVLPRGGGKCKMWAELLRRGSVQWREPFWDQQVVRDHVLSAGYLRQAVCLINLLSTGDLLCFGLLVLVCTIS